MEEIETGSESIESGELTGATSDASGSESGSESQAPASDSKQQQEIDWAKAFEHPRFKEVIGQKNEALDKYREMENRYKALEQQLNSFKESQPKAPTETDALMEDLKKVDPRLAATLQRALQGSETAAQLQAKLEAFERQSQENAQRQEIQTAVSKINSWHEANKVSPETKQMINDKLDLLYMQGKLNSGNLEQAYKSTHESIKKWEEAFSRSIRESYVKEKSKDAAVPASQPKGPAPKAAQKQLNVPRDKEALKQAVVKSFIKEQAANRDATNN